MLVETLFKSFNNKITTTGKKRDKEQIPKGRRKLEITLANYCYNKWKQKNKETRIEVECLRTV